MDRIELNNCYPNVFADRIEQLTPSQIWLDDCSFERGKKYLIEAESGSGKTSLFNFLYGHRQDYQGQIQFDGISTKNLSTDRWRPLRRKQISHLFQDLKLFEELSAIDNIQLKNQLTHHKTEPQIINLFERLNIADRIHFQAGKMSLGQQQRVAFIRTLCQPADFILLDEPISHIDDTNAAIMVEILNEEVKQSGAALLVSSIGKTIPLHYDRRLQL